MFIITGLTLFSGAVWYTLHGSTVYGPINIYGLMYFCHCIAAICVVLGSRNPARLKLMIWVYCGVIVYYLVPFSFLSFSILYVVLALPLIMCGTHLRYYAVAGLWLFGAFCGVLGWFNVFGDRVDAYIAFSYPDLIAGMGYAINIILGLDDRYAEQYSFNRANSVGCFKRYHTVSSLFTYYKGVSQDKGQ